MKKFIVTIFACFFAGIIFFPLIAAPVDADVKKVSEMKPKNVIRCSPDARDGTSLPVHALAKLTKGDQIIFLPGNYREVIINQNSVIISTEGEQKVQIYLSVRGKNCIIKDFWGGGAHFEQDFIVVNSVLNYVSLAGSEKKTSATIYNSAFRNINVFPYANDWEINIKNCVIRGGPSEGHRMANPPHLNEDGGIIRVTPRSIFEIENSVLSSNDHIFNLYLHSRSLRTKILLKDNIIFGKNGIGVVSESPDDRNDNLAILNLKDMKKVVSTSLQGENKVEAIEFMSDDSEVLEYFLVKKPELKGIGIILEQNTFFKPKDSDKIEEEIPQEKEDVKTVQPPPPRREQEEEEEEDVFKMD